MIGRREFFTLVGGGAAWPLVAQAQQDLHNRLGSDSGHGSSPHGRTSISTVLLSPVNASS